MKNIIWVILGAVAIGLILHPYDLPWQVTLGAGGLWAVLIGVIKEV